MLNAARYNNRPTDKRSLMPTILELETYSAKARLDAVSPIARGSCETSDRDVLLLSVLSCLSDVTRRVQHARKLCTPRSTLGSVMIPFEAPRLTSSREVSGSIYLERAACSPHRAA